jgi:hypothetical protein
MNYGGSACFGNNEIWKSLAPKKCKIFAWLAPHNRLSTRDRSAKRGVISDARCPFGCQTDEVPTHLLFNCSHTSFIWNKFQIQGAQDIHMVQDTVTNPRHMQPVQRKDWTTIFIAIDWNIQLTRNGKVFFLFCFLRHLFVLLYQLCTCSCICICTCTCACIVLALFI